MIQLNGISKRFGGVQALRDVSLQLRAGQVHCLAGENGSGKSTLIKVLAGVLRPDAGTITVDQKPIDRLTPIDSVRHGIQVIYQDLSLFPNLTVAENLSLNSQLEHRAWLVHHRRMRQTARQAMERLGMSLPLDASAGHLPVAQKQLVAIARALVQDARLIVLDEPTTALTHIEEETLFQILGTLREQGVAILFVSHKLREMQRIGDYHTILRGGQVVAEGPANQFDLARNAQSLTGRTMQDDRQPPNKPAASHILLDARQLSNNELRDVSLSLFSGQRVGLTGLLGSGQTALALALFGLLSPRLAHQYAEHWRDELAMAAPHVSAPVSSHSGGNGQRVVLAKWLSCKPKLLILNDPTVGVDIGSKEGIHEKLRQLAVAGMGVLMISDDLNELARHCDRVLIMHHGQIVKELAGDDLTEQAISESLNHLE